MIAGHHGLLKMGTSNPKNIIPSQIVKVAKKQMGNPTNEPNERSASAYSRPSANWNSYSPFESQVNLQDHSHQRSSKTFGQTYSYHHQGRQCLHRNHRHQLYGGRLSSSFDSRTSFAAHYSSSFLSASSQGSNYAKRRYTASEDEKQSTWRRGPWIPFARRDHKKLRDDTGQVDSNESVGQKSSSCANMSSASINEAFSIWSPSSKTKHDEQKEKEICDKTRCEHTELLLRKWENCFADPCLDESVQNVGTCSVMSYNILSQTLLELNKGLYKHCDQEVLPWTYRWNNIQKELSLHKPDIACLQEIEEEHYNDDIQPWFEANGYTCSYKRRTGGQDSKPDGVLTACLSKKFEIIETKPVEYFRRRAPLTAWHNVGLINVVKLTSSSDEDPSLICVGNTHLVYNPRRGDVKLIQLATFLAELKQTLDHFTKKTASRPPLLLCGDFNSTPFSPLYSLITTGALDYAGLNERLVSGQHVREGGRAIEAGLLPACLRIDETCSFVEGNEIFEPRLIYTLQHDLGLLASTSEHRHFEATTMQDRGITVDYIFYSSDESSLRNKNSPSSYPIPCATHNTPTSTKQLETNEENTNDSSKLCVQKGAKRLELLLKGSYSSCTGRDIYQVHGLPNSAHSSDHLPVLAEFYVNVK